MGVRKRLADGAARLARGVRAGCAACLLALACAAGAGALWALGQADGLGQAFAVEGAGEWGQAFAAERAFADEPADDDGNAVDAQQLPDSSFIYDTSIADLSAADTYYDEQTVQVTGEVVGDCIRAGADDRHCWITLASDDGLSTVAVYLPIEAAAKIDTYGAYGRKGTTLQVQGTFYLACAEHDGVSDVHASIVSVVAPGKETPDEFDSRAFAPGLAAIALGLGLMGVYYWLRERQR